MSDSVNQLPAAQIGDTSQTTAPDNPVAAAPAPETKVDEAITAKSQVEQDADATNKLKHRSVVLTEVAVILGVSVVLINFLLIYLTNNQVAQYHINRQQIAAAEYNSSDRAHTIAFLESQKLQTELILAAFPVENNFIDFIQTLELIGQESATNSRLEFSTLVVPKQGQSYVPFVINMTTDMANFGEFLKKTEKLAYLVEITSTEANTVDESNRLWNFKVNAKVYVSNQFK